MKSVIKVMIAMSIMLLLSVVPASGHTEQESFTTKLLAGQHTEAGEVWVWNDDQSIYVAYNTTDGWSLIETHLHVATSLDDIPQTKKGNPIPGHFDYKTTHISGTTNYIYEIPLGDWEMDQELYLAAHSEVARGIELETAWGAGEPFPGKNWAMYFTYTLQMPYCEMVVELPDELQAAGTMIDILDGPQGLGNGEIFPVIEGEDFQWRLVLSGQESHWKTETGVCDGSLVVTRADYKLLKFLFGWTTDVINFVTEIREGPSIFNGGTILLPTGITLENKPIAFGYPLADFFFNSPIDCTWNTLTWEIIATTE